MSAFQTVKDWLPSVAFLVVATILALVVVQPLFRDTPFKPLEANNIVFQTPGPYAVSQEVTITNGLCNRSDQAQLMSVTAGFVEDGVDRLVARTVPILPRTGQPAIVPIAAKHCEGTGEISGPLPSALSPGYWRFYYGVTVLGSDNRTQTIARVSEPIEVR